MTIALHRVFDTKTDKIIWDVGHQSYTHKIITGRKDEFENLRCLGGISGFPRFDESVHDCFNTGHASTSISAALGLATARDLEGKKHSVIAVIGDGALTGGLAYEGMNNAGRIKSNFIVVLNDNEMSISKNVGALSKYLNRLRSDPNYFKAKKDIDAFLNKIPKYGGAIANKLQRAKDGVRYLLMQSSMFEVLGFAYYGPIDGHDIPQMVDFFNRAKKVEGPVLLHIYTKKGKGYSFAEDEPCAFHGIGSFDICTGRQNGEHAHISTAKVFGKKLVDIAKKNKKVVAITAAMPDGTGLSDFAEKYKNRFFDVGIAEQHSVTFAAGLAKEHFVPVVAVYSTFLQRSYDQILHDVALQKLHVVFAIDRSGIVGEDGETHHGIYDISYLSHIPNLSILAPSSPKQLEQMLDYAINEHTYPIAIRYNKAIKDVEHCIKPFEFAKAQVVKTGKDITVVAVGNMLSTAVEAVALSGVDAEVIDLGTIKPLDIKTIRRSANKTGKIIVIEDNVIIGGAGSQIEIALSKPVIKLGYDDNPLPHGQQHQLYKKYKLDAKSVARLILKESGIEKTS